MPKNPLEALHKSMGAFLVERAGTPMPARYGEVRTEHLMVRKTVGVFDLFSAGKIAVRGPERLRFLQAMLAEDLTGLKPGAGVYSLVLSRDARIAGEMRLLVRDDKVILLTPSIARAKVKGLLERHLAAGEATVVDESDVMALISVQGRATDRVLEATLGVHAPRLIPFASKMVTTRLFGEVLLIGAPRGGETGFDLMVASAAAAALFQKLVDTSRIHGGGPAGLEALDSLRVEVGLPAYGSDMDETTLPTELDVIGRGISMGKGCFLGREELAKLIDAGPPARRLVGALYEGSYPPVRGDRLFLDGRPVGAVTSSAYSPMLNRPLALAMVSAGAAARGTQLKTSDDEVVQVTRIPFWDEADSTAGPSV